MSKAKILRQAPIQTAILLAIRDNPGQRPCQLFARPELAVHKVSWFWLRSLKDRGLIIDERHSSWEAAFDAWLQGNRSWDPPKLVGHASLKLTEAGRAWLASHGA